MAERGVKSLLEGARAWAAASSESCSLVRSTMGEPSCSCHSEGHVRQTRFQGSRLSGPSEVWGVARAHSPIRNRRDPSAPPTSGKDRSYKPMAKSTGAQRKSDGVVVPPMGVQHNAPGGKDPDFDGADSLGKRRGMVGFPRPKLLRGHTPAEQTRRLGYWLGSADKRAITTMGMPIDAVGLTLPGHGLCLAMTGCDAADRRSKASRVRENRMHGFKGGRGNGHVRVYRASVYQ